MATQTTNYHLIKPEYGDAADISVLNDNMDTVDSELKSQSDRIDGVTDDFSTFKPSGNGTADQILRTNGDGTTRWDNAATQAEIGAAVTDWLDEHVSGGQTLAVDDTLSVQGAAADSKKTGDKIADLKSAIAYRGEITGSTVPSLFLNDSSNTNRGLTVSAHGNIIEMDGTLSSASNRNIKITNGTDYGWGVQDGWKAERLNLVSGDKYLLIINYISGTLTGADGLVGAYVRNNANSTIIYKQIPEGSTEKYTYADMAFAATGDEAFIMVVAPKNGVYTNYTISVELINISRLSKYLYTRDYSDYNPLKSIGFLSVVREYGVRTSNGIDIEKFGDFVRFTGTPTVQNNVRAKLSNNLLTAGSSDLPTTWTSDRLDVIPGHRYKLYVDVMSNSGSSLHYQITVCDKNKTALSYCTIFSDTAGIYDGKEFVAENDSVAYVILNIWPGFTYNVEARVYLLDVTDATIYVKEILKRAGLVSQESIDKLNAFFEDRYYNIGLTSAIYTDGEGNDTTYYVASIPFKDSDGQIIPIFADYDPINSPMYHAIENKTSLTSNSGMITDYTDGGTVIKNGEIVHSMTPRASNYLVYIGFDAERNIREYPYDTSGETMLNDGVVNAATAYYRLVRNGTVVDVSNIGLPASNLNNNPRNSIFIKADKTICFLACNGREKGAENGLTPAELGNLMVSLGAVDGWNLDGGGSTSLTVKGVKQNKHIDGGGTIDRNIHVTWNVPGIEEYAPVCDKIADGTYELRCVVADGKKSYEWVSA